MTVTFDHLKPALVNSCIGMSESCVQKEQREKETERWDSGEKTVEGKPKCRERKQGYKIGEKDSLRN